MRILLLLFLICVSLGCSSQKKNPGLIKKEIYQSKWPNGQTDFIELNYHEDTSITGVYRGVFIDEDSSYIYFKSDFIKLNIVSAYDLVFELDRFTLSKTAFLIQSDNDNNNVKSNISEIPYIFQHSWYFLGSYSGDTLNISKTTPVDIGSTVHKMIFTRVGQ